MGIRPIETSTVVKTIAGKHLQRMQLASTGKRTVNDPDWLGKAINNWIANQDFAILTGVREQQVHNYLHKEHELIIIELFAPATIRFMRLLDLRKVNDAKEFIEQDIRENNLGIREVIEHAEYRIPTHPFTQPKEIAKTIKKFIEPRLPCN